MSSNQIISNSKMSNVQESQETQEQSQETQEQRQKELHQEFVDKFMPEVNIARTLFDYISSVKHEGWNKSKDSIQKKIIELYPEFEPKQWRLVLRETRRCLFVKKGREKVGVWYEMMGKWVYKFVL